MFSYYVLAVVCSFLPALSLADDKVNVVVYYESLCPDSQKYINNQLAPAFNSPLAVSINLTLVPYGNANTSSNGTITCQHGPTECYGNRIQACAISKLTMEDQKVKFIDCLMKMAYDKKPANNDDYNMFITKCAQNHSLTDQVSAIENCANSTESDSLMAMYGNMTKNADPKIKGVPTTFFNNKSSKEINDNARSNFVKTLCGFISGNKPAECKGNSASDIASSVFLVASALLISRYY